MSDNAKDDGNSEAPEAAAAPTEVAEQVDEAPVEETREPTLTDQLVERFNHALDTDHKDAYRRWGFTLFYSLSDEEAHAQQMRLQPQPRDGLDHYNLGCHSASQEKYAKAAEAFAEALKSDPGFAEARFNLALALEKTGDIKGARELWQEHLDRHGDSEDDVEIKARLAETAGQ